MLCFLDNLGSTSTSLNKPGIFGGLISAGAEVGEGKKGQAAFILEPLIVETPPQGKSMTLREQGGFGGRV